MPARRRAGATRPWQLPLMTAALAVSILAALLIAILH